MIRESLAANAAHASVFVTPGNDISFQRRPSTGAVTQYTAAVANVAPYWVRLQRRGGTITAATSAERHDVEHGRLGHPGDGHRLYRVGGDRAQRRRRRHRHVRQRGRGSADGTNQPPTVTLTAPANGATFTAPATVTMTATASDTRRHDRGGRASTRGRR